MRIDTSIKWQMLILAAIFDTLAIVPKIFMVIGIAGALTVSWIPFFGQMIGVAAIGATTALNFMFTWLFMFVGYTWMWGWLLTRDVPIFGGKNLEKKALILPLTLLADMMPLIGTLLPGITVWTYTQIRFAEREDRERFKHEVARAQEALQRYQIQMKKIAQQEQILRSRAMIEAVANDTVPDQESSDTTTYRRPTLPVNTSPYVMPHAA
jgi:hypothetical protein